MYYCAPCVCSCNEGQTSVDSQWFKVSSSYSVNTTKVRVRQPCATDRDPAFNIRNHLSLIFYLYVPLSLYSTWLFMHSGTKSHPTPQIVLATCGDPGVGFHGCFLLVYFINQSVLTGSESEHVGSLIDRWVLFSAQSSSLLPPFVCLPCSLARFPFPTRRKTDSVVTSTPKRKDSTTSCVQKYFH